jgi:hypothetical protein
MNRTVTIILVIVLLALIGAAWLLDRPQPTPTPSGSVTPTLAPVWSIVETDLTEVRFEDLKNKNVPALDMRKDQSGNWILYGMLTGDSRLSREADQTTVTSVLGQVILLNPVADLGEGLNLQTFGVDKTGFLLTIKTADGTTRALEISRDTTPTGNGYYVLLQGTNRVYIVPTSSVDPLFGFLINQPILATVTPPPATATPDATATGATGTEVLSTATATPAP